MSQSRVVLKIQPKVVLPLQPSLLLQPSQPLQPSPCVCYILRSTVANKVYIGFTTDFAHRIRQHNGEIVGGAKRTERFRPWIPVSVIQGFFEQHSARRFEYRLQHPRSKPRKGVDRVLHILQVLTNLITAGDGPKESVMPWPTLTIRWYDERFAIQHERVVNIYT